MTILLVYIFCHRFSGNASGALSKESWPQTLSVLRYKLCVLAEPEPTFGRYFCSPFIKKIQVFWQRRKTFHSIFTYCRCSPLLLNDGGWDVPVTCGLILHLLHSFVPLLSYANGKHLCRSWRQRKSSFSSSFSPRTLSFQGRSHAASVLHGWRVRSRHWGESGTATREVTSLRPGSYRKLAVNFGHNPRRRLTPNQTKG